MFHYDYERDKADYPDAHMQVSAASAAWDELLAASGKKDGSLSKLHLPVGRMRCRPALEDILEAQCRDPGASQLSPAGAGIGQT